MYSAILCLNNKEQFSSRVDYEMLFQTPKKCYEVLPFHAVKGDSQVNGLEKA